MKKPLVNLSFIFLFIGLMVNGMGQSVLFSILAPLSRSIGFMDSGVGIIISCSAAVLVVFSLLWGRVIDRVNVKCVFIFGLISFGIGSLLFAYVLDLGQKGVIFPGTILLLLIVVRMIYAAMTAGTHPSAMAYVTKLTGEKERVSSIALISSSYSIGLVVGPAIVFIYDNGDVLSPIYFTSYLAIFVAIASVFVLKGFPSTIVNSVKENKVNSLKFWDGRIFPALISLMFINVTFSCIQQSAGFLVQDLFIITESEATRKTGGILSTIALVMLFTQVVLIQKFKIDYKKMISVGYVLASLGLTSIVFSTVYISFFSIVISMAITGVGIGYLIPSLQTHLTLFASSDEQGKIAGYIFSFSALGYIIGPLLGTGLIGLATWMPYLMSIVMLIFSATCVLFGSKHGRKSTSNGLVQLITRK
ncbi:MFS transporter [Photobacterium leiognathi]|uniref:MFS transporter n=1 Tax=Photobacterium leiognathi TaxID=553611 RepID=UPI0027391770|nr:MFS transporter [Photobacterium leiognathi]